MKNYLHKNLVYLAAVFYVLLALQSLHAITLKTLTEYPSGTIYMTLKDENGSLMFRVMWGGDTDKTGKNGPFVQLHRNDSKTPEIITLKQDTVDKLFGACSKLASNYYIPRSTIGDASNKNEIQLHFGTVSDPIMLTFPANEPKLWNSAVEHWAIISAIFKSDASVEIPLSSPIKDNSNPMPKGMSSITDFTTLTIEVTKVNRTKFEYGTITISWKRAENGEISFDAQYVDRQTRIIKSKPSTKQIKPLFDEAQSLAKSYSYPSFAFNKKNPLGRNYDSIDVRFKPSNQPGFSKLPFFSTDSAQWKDADSLWNLAKELFPEDNRNIIVQ
jgi:hypothetical protein